MTCRIYSSLVWTCIVKSGLISSSRECVAAMAASAEVVIIGMDGKLCWHYCGHDRGCETVIIFQFYSCCHRHLMAK